MKVGAGAAALSSRRSGLAFAAILLALAGATHADEARPTLVFVPGVTGSRLETAAGRALWGTGRRLLLPRDRGHEIALAIASEEEDGSDRSREGHEVRATAVLDAIRLAGITKEIYRPLSRALEAAGYRSGDPTNPSIDDDLYFFAYDWRRDNTEVAGALHRFLERVATTRGDGRFDLACQSNASRICRYLVKYGGSSLDEAAAGAVIERSYRIEKVVLVGASNGGSLRQLHELDRGRRYIPIIGRFLAPETLFTIRPLFSDLPTYQRDLFVDEAGNALNIDLFDAETWVRYGWSVFSPRVAKRLKKRLEQRPEKQGSDLFGDHQARIRYLRERLEAALREQRLLDADSPAVGDTEYFLLANRSAATPKRAVLVERRKSGRAARKGRFKTLFADDRRVRRNPKLLALTAVEGDGHATVQSQQALSRQEQAALRGTAWIEGGHFDTIVEPATHSALVRFLLEGPESLRRPASDAPERVRE